MEERLEAILIWLEQAIQTTGDFLSEQTPLVILETLAYYRAYYTTILVFESLIGIVCVIWAIRKSEYYIKWMLKEECPHPFIVVWILAAVGCITAVSDISRTMKVWFAPRLFLLEWAKTFF